MKHLKVLEDNDLVVSYEEKSTLGGPPRKSYTSNKRITLRIDVGPNTFNIEAFDFKELEDKIGNTRDFKEKYKEYEHFEDDFKKYKKIEDPNKRLNEYSKLVQNLNNELEDLKIKSSRLLTLREHILKESNKIISELCNKYDERKILYYLIMNAKPDISEISEIMEMREKVIREIFQNLIKQRILLDFEEDFF